MCSAWKNARQPLCEALPPVATPTMSRYQTCKVLQCRHPRHAPILPARLSAQRGHETYMTRPKGRNQSSISMSKKMECRLYACRVHHAPDEALLPALWPGGCSRQYSELASAVETGRSAARLAEGRGGPFCASDLDCNAARLQPGRMLLSCLRITGCSPCSHISITDLRSPSTATPAGHDMQ